MGPVVGPVIQNVRKPEFKDKLRAAEWRTPTQGRRKVSNIGEANYYNFEILVGQKG